MIGWILFSILLVILFLLVWYIKKLFNNLKIIAKEFQNIKHVVLDYVNHIDHVHSLEMYYGEPVLKNLIDHGKATVKKIKNFEKLFNSIAESEEEDEEQELEEESELGNVQIMGTIRK